MQLKASFPDNVLLVSSLDIEIVCQTHLLRPKFYREDCLRLFGRVIDHIEQFFKETAFIDTCLLYKERFGERCYSFPIQKKDRKAALNNHSRQ
jgi:hypothetical protein